MTEPNDTTPTPAKEAKERRSVLMPIRWKPSEFNLVKFKAQAATGGDLSEYVRSAALGSSTHALSLEERRGLIKLSGEMGKIGSNINQIARATNQGKPYYTGDMIRALQAVEKCADEIRYILTNHKTTRQ